MNQGNIGAINRPADRSNRRRLRLGEVLVNEGLATEMEIQVALKQQKRESEPPRRHQRRCLRIYRMRQVRASGRPQRLLPSHQPYYPPHGGRAAEASCS